MKAQIKITSLKNKVAKVNSLYVFNSWLSTDKDKISELEYKSEENIYIEQKINKRNLKSKK